MSYEQRHALWKGTGFKGLSAYGSEFIKQALNQEKPVCKNLFDLHQQMNIKDFSLEKEYLYSIEKSRAEVAKINLWNSSHPEAVAFREQVFNTYPALKEKMKPIRKVSEYSFINDEKYRIYEKMREN